MWTHSRTPSLHAQCFLQSTNYCVKELEWESRTHCTDKKTFASTQIKTEFSKTSISPYSTHPHTASSYTMNRMQTSYSSVYRSQQKLIFGWQWESTFFSRHDPDTYIRECSLCIPSHFLFQWYHGKHEKRSNQTHSPFSAFAGYLISLSLKRFEAWATSTFTNKHTHTHTIYIRFTFIE